MEQGDDFVKMLLEPDVSVRLGDGEIPVFIFLKYEVVIYKDKIEWNKNTRPFAIIGKIIDGTSLYIDFNGKINILWGKCESINCVVWIKKISDLFNDIYGQVLSIIKDEQRRLNKKCP